MLEPQLTDWLYKSSSMPRRATTDDSLDWAYAGDDIAADCWYVMKPERELLDDKVGSSSHCSTGPAPPWMLAYHFHIYMRHVDVKKWYIRRPQGRREGCS
jgi:hypothetical protein